MRSFENIVYDLDGTLIDSQEDIRNTFVKAFYLIYDMKISGELIKIGQPLEEMVRNLGISEYEEKVNDFIAEFRNLYKNSDFPRTVCYQGIKSLLNDQSSKGKKIFIATNKPEYLTRSIIKKLEIDLFYDICAIDSGNMHLSKTQMIDHLIKKHNLRKENTIMIGDTDSDIIAAHKNSILSVGVGYGYGDKSRIISVNPDYFFDNVDQLSRFLISN